MLRKLLFCLTLFVIFGSSALARGATDSVDWNTNFDKAVALSKETGKPLLIDFWAIWCGPCKQMDADVWSEGKVINLSKKFIAVSIDVDKDKATASRFGVHAIPTIVFADSWGNSIIRNEGYMGFNQMASAMNGFPSDFSSINELNVILKNDKKNLTALMGLGQFYAKIGGKELSNRYYNEALKSPEVQGNPKLHEELLVKIGNNYLGTGELKDANKTFQQCLKDFPNGSACDQALSGEVLALAAQGKTSDATKVFNELKAKYPDSQATKRAEQFLANPKPKKSDR